MHHLLEWFQTVLSYNWAVLGTNKLWWQPLLWRTCAAPAFCCFFPTRTFARGSRDSSRVTSYMGKSKPCHDARAHEYNKAVDRNKRQRAFPTIRKHRRSRTRSRPISFPRICGFAKHTLWPKTTGCRLEGVFCQIFILYSTGLITQYQRSTARHVTSRMDTLATVNRRYLLARSEQKYVTSRSRRYWKKEALLRRSLV